MKKVLLLGAISPFCDLVKEMEQLNIEPIVCDYYSDAPAKQMGYLSYDISTTDVDSLVDISVKNGIDGVVNAFSDRNLLPALDICTRLKYDYFFDELIIRCLTDKLRMKQFFLDNNIPIIRYSIIGIDDIKNSIEDYDFPVVIKPIDAYGSKGVHVCENINEVIELFNSAVAESLNYKEQIIVEEFYKADEISVTGWVKGGKVYITCIYDVFRNYGDSVVLSGVAFPSKYSARYYNELLKLFGKIVDCFDIQEGPLTLQCFIGDKGIKVSELLCRLAGGSPYLYAVYLGGPNIARMMIQYLVNEPVDYQNLTDFMIESSKEEVYYDIQVLVNKKGVVNYVIDVDTIKDRMPEVIDIRVYYKNGAVLENVSATGVFFARVICKCLRDYDYYELIGRLEQEISIYNDKSEIVSYIPKPQRMDVNHVYDVEWDFL